MELGGATFQHWLYLQECLKFEKLHASHGIPYPETEQRRSLLDKLRTLLANFYEVQLNIRESFTKSGVKKVLERNPRETLGNAFPDIEAFVLGLRNSHTAFTILVDSINPATTNVDLLVESFAFSFFDDLVNPHSSERELLQAINELARLEFIRRPHITTMFQENSASMLSKMLVFYTKRKAQAKYLKLLFKKPLAKLAVEHTEDWVLDLKGVQALVESRPAKAGSVDDFYSHLSAKALADTEIDPSEFLEQAEVKDMISHFCQQVCTYTQLFLDSIYSNLKAMPNGLRGVCKVLSDLSKTTGPYVEETRNRMLGTLLFLMWWLPAIVRSEENGLLQTFHIGGIRKNISLVANVIKKVFRGELFPLPQYREINEFITHHM